MLMSDEREILALVAEGRRGHEATVRMATIGNCTKPYWV